jgi:hypothetical protein
VTGVRDVTLGIDAAAALRQLLGIMIDQGYGGWGWDLEHVMGLDTWLEVLWDEDEWRTLQGEPRTLALHIEDAALLLEGMAFTEVASAELPWIDMVRWTSDFVTSELRRHWTEDEWRALPDRPSR